MEQKILNAYKRYSYPGAQKLHQLLKQEGIKATLKQVKGVIAKQTTYQLHKKQAKKVKKHMVAFLPSHKWLIDLLDMQNYARENKGYRYILLGIDVFTREGFAIPLKDKTGPEVLKAFKEMIEDGPGKPQKLISDNGSEFMNTKFQKYLKEQQIFHETNEPGYHPSLGVIDRLSRTIKEKIFRSFTDHNNAKWYDILDGVMLAYNVTPHDALLGIAPADAQDNQELIHDINIQKNLARVSTKLRAGMLVRKRLTKSIFKKGYKVAWSSQTYTIKSISGVNAELDNDEIVKLNDLQAVAATEEIPNSKVVEVEKEVKIDRKLQQDGIEPTAAREKSKRIPLIPKEIPEPKPKSIAPKRAIKQPKPQVYNIDKVIGQKKVGKQVMYHVTWEGYEDPADYTWEPAKNISHTLAFKEYKQSLK